MEKNLMTNLPKEKFIQDSEATNMTGLPKFMRISMEQDGEFPRRHKISNGIMAYLESEILEWAKTHTVEVMSLEIGKS